MNNRGTDIEPAANGTCAWLLKHKIYTEWLCHNQGLLWIKGKPGAGKSTLMKYALQALKEQESLIPNKLATISFFFHGRGAEIQRTPLGLFRSLLYQLLERFPGLLSDIVQTFDRNCKNIGPAGEKWTWRQQDLREFLETGLPKILEQSAIRILVDALDECGAGDAQKLLDLFRRLGSKCSSAKYGLSICFSCRHYPILFSKGFEICVEDENHDDIRRYIQDELGHAIQDDGELETLQDEFITRSSGIFQWVVLVLPQALLEYNHGNSLLKIQKMLQNIPPELDSLYKNVLQSLNEGNERLQSLQLMQWICFAHRPLSLTELRFAMIADWNTPYHSLEQCQLSPDFVKDDKKMEKRVKSLSGGLAEVKVHENKLAVQFIHQSVNDYLTKEGLRMLDSLSESEDASIGRAHIRLSRSCIRYIAMGEIHRWRGKHKEALEALNRWEEAWKAKTKALQDEFPFLAYATTSWLSHAKMVEAKKMSQEDLFDYYSRWPLPQIMQDWVGIYRLIDPYSDECPPTETTLLHAASRHGLISAVRFILNRLERNGVKIDSKDNDGRTPLSWAAVNGHEAGVRLLLERGA